MNGEVPDVLREARLFVAEGNVAGAAVQDAIAVHHESTGQYVDVAVLEVGSVVVD